MFRHSLDGEVGTKLGLIVRDAEEFVEFYQKPGFDMLLRTAHHGGSAEKKLPGEDQPVLEIHSAFGEESIWINHIAFKVPNAQEADDDVVSKGIKLDRGPHLVEITGGTNVNMRDPDGWHLQMVCADRIAPNNLGCL